MQTTDRGYSLFATATISAKHVNQDAEEIAYNPEFPLAAVVVADGVGSHYGAEVASAIVASYLARKLKALLPGECLDMRRLFAGAQQCLRNEVEANLESLPPDLDRNHAFGTTAICVAETANVLTFGYAGNGGIFHIRGNFNTFPSSQLLPWSAINHLNPHALSVQGKNVMYQLLSPWGTPEATVPSVVTISKDDDRFGDIVLCCTDGIYSYDQTAIGRDDKQNIWISGEDSMARFYKNLARFFEAEPSADALQKTLDAYLADLATAGLLHDDCTVGVLITQKALAYQAQLRERRPETVTA